MADIGLTRKPARQLAKLIRERTLSPVEVLEAHIAVIETLNPTLNAVVTLAAEQARDDARRAEQSVMQGETLGPLHGLPVAIKDITPTAGIRTTFASPLYKDNVPAEDAEIVRRLKAAGAIVLAKTNTPEFACGANTDNALFGPTRNPWNPDLSPAGSSGGSAVAVATGMVPIAHGTDFGGSIRVPAAFCGILGLRPTPGLTPNYPMPLAWDPGQVHGALARDAEDAALMLDAMVGLSSLSPISVEPPWRSAIADMQRRDLAKLRVAYASDIAGIGVDIEIDNVCRAAALRLADCGADLELTDLDLSDGREPYQTWRGLWMVGQQFERLSALSSFGPNLKSSVEAGLKLTALDFAAAENKRRQIYDRVRAFFEHIDVLLTPTAPVRPFALALNFPSTIGGHKLADYIDWIAPTFVISLLSLPAASAPAGLTKDGLPVGIQIVAPRFAEPLILSIAKVVQSTSGVGWPPDAM
jgi:amidase